MGEAYIVAAVRSPVGRRGGGLSTIHPADLGAAVIEGLINTADVDPAAVDDVIFGCVDSIGPQSYCIARTCWLAAGMPEHVPGVVIDRQCGSSQQAVHFAAQAVASGYQDLVVAGGIECMSQIPLLAGVDAGKAHGFPDPHSGSVGWVKRYGPEPLSQFRGGEMMAAQWDLTREQMEAYALESHRRAIEATDAGRFAGQIVPIGDVSADEGPRRDTSAEKLAALATLTPGGRLTAGVASQISDGAAALLIAAESAVRDHGLRPLARIHSMTVRANDPIMMLSAPIVATRAALTRAGLGPSDIDLAECNEAFASVVLAWLAETGFDPARVNVNGGAIALGHPLGASGARIMTTLVHELVRSGGRYGLQTMCEGGGQANVTVLERVA
jgi:acetyl-CoA C-acetyltransferase